MDDLFDVVRRFREADIRFVLIGGLALVAHGGTHDTLDVDFSIALDDANCDKVISLLQPLRPRPLAWPSGQPFQIERHTLRRARFLNLKTDIGAIDLLPLPAGVDSFEGLWERAVEMDLGGYVVRIASIDDLIAMKKAAGRPKDERHLMELAALKRIIAEEMESA